VLVPGGKILDVDRTKEGQISFCTYLTANGMSKEKEIWPDFQKRKRPSLIHLDGAAQAPLKREEVSNRRDGSAGSIGRAGDLRRK